MVTGADEAAVTGMRGAEGGLEGGTVDVLESRESFLVEDFSKMSYNSVYSSSSLLVSG